MKKQLFTFTLLCCMVSALCAEPLATAATVDLGADASVAFGVDLNNGETGFKNETNIDLKLYLLPTDMEVSTFNAGVWGELVLKLDGDTAYEVDGPSGTVISYVSDNLIVDKAVIHIYDGYVSIETDDFDFGDEFAYPHAMAFDNEDTLNADGIYYNESSPSQSFGYYQGFSGGYVHDLFTVEASVRTQREYTAENIAGITDDLNTDTQQSLLIPYVEGEVCTNTSDIPYPIVNGNWVVPPGAVYRLYPVKEESARDYTNNYAVGLYSTITPVNDLIIGLGGAYAFTGIRQGDFSVFSAAQYKANFGMFSLFPVLTYNLFGDFNDGTGEMTFTQNTLGFGINFGWGDEMEGDSLLYDFYEEKLAYVGTLENDDIDQGDGTILPGVSLYTSLDFLPGGLNKSLPFLVMVHSGDIVPNVSAQILYSTSFANGTKETLWNNGQESATTAMNMALDKLASQIGFAADYDIAVGQLTVTPALGVLFGYSMSQNDLDTTLGTSLLPIVNVKLAGLVKNTEFTLEWNEFEFATGAATVGGVSEGVLAIDAGVISLKAEITL